ncbi:MAG TPA: BT_3928 family protein [Flavobacterium sp.]|nr:BT_3928 family protein [Flavobacterium sp.]
MLKLLTHFSRLFVGVLFIISGLIKLNDPVGFSFKLEEYFSQDVLNLVFLEPFALAIAVFMVIVEVILGIMLLIGYKRKFTLWALLLMIVFFTFLTFYSAYFNKVTDCGCFGDAIKLTPWGSFTKDIVLLVFILILFAGYRYIKPIFSPKTSFSITAIALVLCGFMGYWVLSHLPIIDFRAYKVGTNIQQAMEIPEGAPKSEYEITFIYNVDGQDKEFKMDELNTLPEGATFVDRKEKLLQEGFVPAVQNFSIEKDGEDYTSTVLEEPKIILVIAYDLEKACPEGLDKIKEVALLADQHGYTIIGLTATPTDSSAPIVAKHDIQIPLFLTDKITLKTVERSNPSFVVLNHGTIIQKVHYNDVKDLRL